LFRLGRVGLEEAQDELVDGGSSHVCPTVDDRVAFRDGLAGRKEGFCVLILEIARGDSTHAAAAGIVVGLLDNGVSAGFDILFVQGELLLVVAGA
jgi:hypothetical protein